MFIKIKKNGILDRIMKRFESPYDDLRSIDMIKFSMFATAFLWISTVIVFSSFILSNNIINETILFNSPIYWNIILLPLYLMVLAVTGLCIPFIGKKSLVFFAFPCFLFFGLIGYLILKKINKNFNPLKDDFNLKIIDYRHNPAKDVLEILNEYN